jgi:hypothetical protein
MAYTKVTGNLVDIGDLDLTNVGQIQLDSIAGDADSNTSITFSGSDVITIATGGSGRLTIGDGALSPVTDNQIDLGTSSLEYKDLFLDGTAHVDTLDVDANATVAGTLGVTGETTLATHLNMGDGDTIKLGDTTEDFEIYHIGGSVNVIRGNPAMVLQSDDYISLGSHSGGEIFLKGTKNGALDLYYDNVVKLSTVTTGAQIAGMLGVNVTANTGHSNSTGSIQISGSNDNYQPGAFNESSLLSLDATNTEGRYAGIRFSHAGGTEGFFGLVRRSATTDITDFVWQGYDGGANAYKEYMRLKFNGNLGINSGYSGTSSVSGDLTAYSALSVQTGASNGDVATNSAFAHFGPLNTASGANTDGYISGVSFGYCESNNNYRHTAIAARAHGDGAARRDMVFLVNGTSEAASAALGDAKLTISSGNGVVSGDLNDTSDLGFKENVADLGNTLSIVNQLKPRTFKWKDERAARGDSVGFIAQEVKSVVSDNTLVQGEEYDPDNLKMTGLSLNTVGLVAYLTKAIQELSTELDAAKARIKVLEG